VRTSSGKPVGWIVWTEVEGGHYHVTRGTREDFETRLKDHPRPRMAVATEPRSGFAYIAYLETVADFDAILGGPRDLSPVPGEGVKK
jgi:hypothetical protein